MFTQRTPGRLLVMVAFCMAPLASDATTNGRTTSNGATTTGTSLPTAQEQLRGSEMDNEMTRLARQRLVNDTNLSVAARNVSIVTLNQKMTLQGMVPTQAERARVVELVSAVSPELQVVDQIKVAR